MDDSWWVAVLGGLCPEVRRKNTQKPFGQAHANAARSYLAYHHSSSNPNRAMAARWCHVVPTSLDRMLEGSTPKPFSSPKAGGKAQLGCTSAEA